MFGSASIISAPTAPDTLVRSVCSSGDSAETSTVWPTVPTDNSTGTRTVSVALRLMPVRLNGAKPARVTVTEYVPAGSSGAVKRPASLVTSSCDTFVPSLVTTTRGAGHDGFLGIGDGAGERGGSDLGVGSGRPCQADQHQHQTGQLFQH